MQTRGEQIFAEYLTASEIPFEFEVAHEGKAKRPDFTIKWAGGECYFDVKDREGSENDLIIVDPLDPPDDDEVFGGAVDPPYKWIRKQIEQGRRKFKEFKGSPCAIVMFPADGWGHDLREPDFVLGAMYGDYGLVIPHDPAGGFASSKARSTFLDNGKMIRPRWRKPQNTTLSALITLREVKIGQARLRRYVDKHYPNVKFWWDPDVQSKVDFDISESHIGAMVWENAFAANPLPGELFRGQYDERWGSSGRGIGRLHLGSVVAECLRDGE
jgi:hypothetical protein